MFLLGYSGVMDAGNSIIVLIVGGVAFCAGGGIGLIVEKSDMEKVAVSKGVGYFHPISRDFVWIVDAAYPTNLPSAK